MTLSSPPIAQNRPASVMSMPISIAVRKRDVAAQQPEPAVDVADEGLHEAVDDVEVVHGCRPAARKGAAGRAGGASAPRGGRRREADAAAAGPVGLSGRVGRAGAEELLGRRARLGLGLRAPRRSIASARYCAAIRFWIWNCCLAASASSWLVACCAWSAPSAPWLSPTSVASVARVGLRRSRRPGLDAPSSGGRRPSRRRAARARRDRAGRVRSAWSKLCGNSCWNWLVDAVDVEVDRPAPGPSAGRSAAACCVSCCSSGKSIRLEVLRLIDRASSPRSAATGSGC